MFYKMRKTSKLMASDDKDDTTSRILPSSKTDGFFITAHRLDYAWGREPF